MEEKMSCLHSVPKRELLAELKRRIHIESSAYTPAIRASLYELECAIILHDKDIAGDEEELDITDRDGSVNQFINKHGIRQFERVAAKQRRAAQHVVVEAVPAAGG